MKTDSISDQSGNSRREFIKKTAITGMGLPIVGALSSSRAMDIMAGSEPSKIHIFSKHLQFLDYDEMAEVAAESGVDGVDLTVRPKGHVLPENVERDLPRAVKAIRKAGLDAKMITTKILDPDDIHTEKILRKASELGIKYYRLGYYEYDPSLGVEKSLDIIKAKLNGLAILNEKYNIHGANQNHAGAMFGSPVWDMWHLIKDMDPRWIGCQYDIRHAVVEGAQSWPLGLELLKDHIHCGVLKDFFWIEQNGKWRIKNVPMGEGMVDFNAYFEQLNKHVISIPFSLHIEYPLYENEDLPVSEKRSSALRAIQHDANFSRRLFKS